MDFMFDPSLVLYLPLYQLDGASFVSKDAHGHTCTPSGTTISWTPTGWHFGGADEVISCGDISASVFDGVNTALSIIVWVCSDDAPAATEMLVCKYDDSSSPKHRTFYFALMSGANEYKTRLYVYADGDATHYVGNTTDAAVATAGTFVCLGATIDLTAATVVMYSGGDVVASTKATGGTPPTTFGNTDRNLTIGRAHNDAVQFDGRIGEVWMYNRILTPQEIQHSYLTTKWRYR